MSGLGLGQICSWGALYYSFPLIAEAMGRDLGWSKTELYGAATLGLLLAAAAAYLVGKAIDRGHGRLIMSAGSLAAGLLFIAWSQVQTLGPFLLIAAGLGALQAAVLYEPAFAVIAHRAGGGARSAITALTLWGGFASTVFIPLMQILLDNFSWRGALMGLGFINLGCAALYWLIIGRSNIRASSIDPAAAATTTAKPMNIALRSPVFWALALAFTAHAGAFTAFTFHLYALLLERGFSTQAIVIAMAVIGPAQVAGRITMTVVARGASIRRIGSVVVLGFPVAFAIFAVAPSGLGIVMFVAALYGASNGVLTIVRGLAVPEMLTTQGYGAINGALNTPATIAKAVAPLGAAGLWSISQSYAPVLIAIIIGSLVLVSGFWTAAWLSSVRGRIAPHAQL
ncbi:MAG: MFS transporter [Hyphomonadaceae bacterium]|nr:MFS transporter [Hyphomonadaceae bacterium]